MPCRTYEFPENTPRDKNRNTAAILCGILTVLESTGQIEQTLSEVDWDEVGLSRRNAEKWWTNHKREDELRRIAEKIAAEKEILRIAALSKLTPEEKKVLGIV